MSKSVVLANRQLNAEFNATSWAAAANIFISLHTANPGITGANEVTGGSYVRQQTSFGAAASGSCANDAAAVFATMPAAVVTHIGVWDALAGNFLRGGQLTESITVFLGGTVTMPIGNIIATET